MFHCNIHCIIMVILNLEYANKTMLFTFSHTKHFQGTHACSQHSDLFSYFMTENIYTVAIFRFCLYVQKSNGERREEHICIHSFKFNSVLIL